MKVLQKQIKLTSIGKYIKKNDMKWLLFLIMPLSVGLILHFAIPVTFVLNGNPTAQQNYNHQKITLEQQTVRSLSLLNSQIIRKKMQRYQNIRNFLIRIFGQKSPYQEINLNQINLNNAYDIANMVKNNQSISSISNRSMWYARGKSSLAQLNQVQAFVFSEYISVQPFIQSEFLNINNSTQQSILRGLSLSANYLGQDIHFQYPSRYQAAFLSLSASSFDKYYNQTMDNYMKSQQKFEYMLFSEIIDGKNQLVICNIIFDAADPVGVACFFVLLTDIATQLTQNLGIPNIVYSTTSYYLLTPIYATSESNNISSPAIVLNFTDKNTSNINFPQSLYLDLPSTLYPALYKPIAGNQSVNYTFYIAFQPGNIIYMQVPINIFSYKQTKNTILFMLVKYNFQGSVFNSIAKYSQILQSLSIPSSIVIVVSTIVSLIVLKCLLNSLDNELHKVNDKCEFLLHGDVDLKIQEYENTQELQHVYKTLRIVNCLHKFSTPQYFHQPEEKKIIKLFKVLQIFQELSYPTDTVLQNIADSYLMMGQILKAIEFLTKSYNILVEDVQRAFEQPLNKILQLKQKENKKLSKKYRRYEIKLIARLFKLILMYNFVLMPPPDLTFRKHDHLSPGFYKNKLPEKMFKNFCIISKKYFRIFKKLAYPNCITSETMFGYLCQARFQIERKNFPEARKILKTFQRIMADYGNDFQINQTQTKEDSPIKTYQQMKNNMSSYCKVSPTIMWSAFYLMQGLYYSELPLESQDINEMVNSFKKATEGNNFSEDIHVRILHQMIKVSYQYGLEEGHVRRLFSSFSYFRQLFPLYHINSHHPLSEEKRLTLVSKIPQGIEREVMFLFDCSNKWINKLQQFRKWQKQVREFSIKIFNLLFPSDRVSILKVNSTVYVSTCCNLTYKNHNQSLLLRQLNNVIKLKFMSGRCKVIDAMKVAVNRIKNLDEKKYVIVFLKEGKDSLNSQRQKQPDKKLKKMTESSSNLMGRIKVHNFGVKKERKNTQVSPYHKESVYSKGDSNANGFQYEEEFEQNDSAQFSQYYKNLRQQILSILLSPQIFNLRILLVTNNAQTFKRRFDLVKVNSFLETQFLKRSKHNNNLLIVVDYLNSSDEIERIFKKKTIQRMGENVLQMF